MSKDDFVIKTEAERKAIEQRAAKRVASKLLKTQPHLVNKKILTETFGLEDGNDI